jgi:hypothetical protein
VRPYYVQKANYKSWGAKAEAGKRKEGEVGEIGEVGEVGEVGGH